MTRHKPSSLDRLKPIFGWWGLDPEGPTLVNKISGQRIRYNGPVQSTDTGVSESWQRFDYEDDLVRYPILIQVVMRASGNWLSKEESTEYMARGNVCIRDAALIKIDHNVSAKFWRIENNEYSEVPPFGLWRRVDDCLSDAFPSCVNFPPTGKFISGVIIRGGWLNSNWHAGFVRSIPIPDEQGRKTFASRELVVADCPFIMPLTEVPPSPWRFHGLPVEAEELDSDRRYIGELKGKRSVSEAGRREKVVLLPSGAPLTGFEGLTPYMQSEDGYRVVFPESATSKMASHTAHVFTIQYADHNVTAIITARNLGKERIADWSFSLRTCGGQPRDLSEKDVFWIKLRKPTPLAQTVPSLTLWRRLSWALNDAWLFWEGTTATSKHWSRELSLSAAQSVSIGPMYLAGIWLYQRYFAGLGGTPIGDPK